MAKGRAPRAQAAVILLSVALQAGVAYASASKANTGMTVCHRRAPADESFVSVKNDCTTPTEYAAGAVIFGLAAAADLGIATYQVASNKQVFDRPRPPYSAERVMLRCEQRPERWIAENASPAEERAGCLRARVEQQRCALRIEDLADRVEVLSRLPNCR
ncbi:MAG: hypothetical protein IPQ07_03315 [Myxococcales bacterium]|nr:hypothetical protein [Myxococcales bacterium]